MLNINNCDYFAPVSHYNKPQRTNFAIYDKDNSKILSTVRFNYMFPALQAVVHKLIIKDVYKTDSRYAILVAKEYDYCSKHEDHLRKRALSVYKIGCNKGHFLNQSCCDFLKLEGEYYKYRR